MNYTNRLGLRVTFELLGNLAWFNDLPERHLDPNGRTSVPLDDIGHAIPEEPVYADDNLVTRFDDVGNGRLHTRHPRPW